MIFRESLRIKNPHTSNTHEQPGIDSAAREELYENPERSGYEIKERADKAVDKYWEHINSQSGANVWQRTHGVLWRIARAPTSEGTKSVITARYVVLVHMRRLFFKLNRDLATCGSRTSPDNMAGNSST